MVPATVTGGTAETSWGRIPVPAGAPQGVCRLLVRPAAVRLGPPDAGLRCVVESLTFRGHHVAVRLRPTGAPPLEAECGLKDVPEVGAEVGAGFAAEDVVVLAPTSG